MNDLKVTRLNITQTNVGCPVNLNFTDAVNDPPTGALGSKPVTSALKVQSVVAASENIKWKVSICVLAIRSANKPFATFAWVA